MTALNIDYQKKQVGMDKLNHKTIVFFLLLSLSACNPLKREEKIAFTSYEDCGSRIVTTLSPKDDSPIWRFLWL